MVATGKTGDVTSPIDELVGDASRGRKYGFKIPLTLTVPALYSLSVRVAIPGDNNGNQAIFEENKTLELRFPIGKITYAAVDRVEGFAIHSARPNDPYAFPYKP